MAIFALLEGLNARFTFLQTHPAWLAHAFLLLLAFLLANALRRCFLLDPQRRPFVPARDVDVKTLFHVVTPIVLPQPLTTNSALLADGGQAAQLPEHSAEYAAMKQATSLYHKAPQPQESKEGAVPSSRERLKCLVETLNVKPPFSPKELVSVHERLAMGESNSFVNVFTIQFNLFGGYASHMRSKTRPFLAAT